MNPTACQVCRQLLNRYTDLATGEWAWRHPAAAGRPDHDPQPVPADTVAAEYRCDFCSDPKVIYVHRTRNVDAHFIADDHHQVHRYGTDWAACITCSMLVEARDAEGLATRAQAAIGADLTGDARHALRQLQATIVDSLQAGRTLTSVGEWQQMPVAATRLPKVRDRLTALLRGPDQIDLLPAEPRQAVADGLDGARLYWVDPEFTDLTRHATAALPDTPFESTDLPAPHGLLAWALPLETMAALSWTSTTNGVVAVGYRAVGAGLQGPDLQRLREHVGWLIPTWCTQIPDGSILAPTNPAQPLNATLLLIAQQLAQTSHAPVDDRIRKAYRRQSRHEPEVRLIQFRGSRGASRSDGNGGQPTGEGVSREYRWWVRGHWRRQPYGPGRSQRRLIYINPQLRGPQDKPIKATTTVRVIRHHQG
ncbi:hypothetical protein EV384_4600 [Micromonospora kangleipakensis]|uniref:Uncharacterized protein n=1 Tax=Micromonospora kangleipakensis TaxID=1077942 RepID=A0A4Q8BF60_9ACTN|nr:hypothetical protein [Micromonospora kangleipakensis]RZU76005.1 hypothetical protein EV384_4600 [Micromonospora kangleipakensis]